VAGHKIRVQVRLDYRRDGLVPGARLRHVLSNVTRGIHDDAGFFACHHVRAMSQARCVHLGEVHLMLYPPSASAVESLLVRLRSQQLIDAL
jgi:hypothetical protein